MATYYSDREINRILQTLHIAPEDGKVDGAEAARILTWRAKEEHDVDYAYGPMALRQHIKTGRIKREEIDPTNKRRNLYPVHTIFSLPISPRRGIARSKTATMPTG